MASAIGRHGHLEGDAVGLDAAQHLVEVEPPVQPHGGAGLGGGEEVEQAEDVRRRGGHLEAVVGGEAERLHPVGGAGARSSGACAAPPSGRPVVPELNTRIASSSGPTSTPSSGRASPRGVESRRVVEVGDGVGAEPLGEQLDGGAVGDGVDRRR